MASGCLRSNTPWAPWCPFTPRDPVGPQGPALALQRGLLLACPADAPLTPLTSLERRDSVEPRALRLWSSQDTSSQRLPVHVEGRPDSACLGTGGRAAQRCPFPWGRETPAPGPLSPRGHLSWGFGARGVDFSSGLLSPPWDLTRVSELAFGGQLVSLMGAAVASLALGSSWQHLLTLSPSEVTDATAGGPPPPAPRES